MEHEKVALYSIKQGDRTIAKGDGGETLLGQITVHDNPVVCTPKHVLFVPMLR